MLPLGHPSQNHLDACDRHHSAGESLSPHRDIADRFVPSDPEEHNHRIPNRRVMEALRCLGQN